MDKYTEKKFDIADNIYLDSSATTSIIPEVYNAMEPYIRAFYGNPSSKYTLGNISKKAIEHAREVVAAAINADPSEIYFTSGGSEANNWVIKGFKQRFRVTPMHFISSKLEHHSITESLKYRCEEHGDIQYSLVSPDKNGMITVSSVTEKYKINTVLCSIQYVNNETGVINQIPEIAERCLDNGIVFHTDAVQAYCQMPIDVKKNHIDLMSMAAHKIHGPKGIGALYISNDVKRRINPFIHGGQQENGMRASTENVAGIVGFGTATEIAMKNMETSNKHEQILHDLLVEQLKTIPGIHLNVDTFYTDPRHISIRIDGIRAEELIAMLDSVHVYVSSGSACNSESQAPSHVLKAIGLTDEEANSSIRISIGNTNSHNEVESFIGYLRQFIDILREH